MLIFKIGVTMVILPKMLQPYFSKAIELFDSIHEYLSKIEDGVYLSSKDKEILWDNLMSWDPEYSENLMKQIDLDAEDYAENWEDNVGDEGMHNIDNCMD